MDNLVFDVLGRLHLEKASLIKLQDFEDGELKRVKPTRSVGEYCWTCTPSLPLYILRNTPSLEMVTYLDADLFFFANPDPLIEEMGNNSIMIIEHRFPDHLKHLEMTGIYNVSMLTFRKDLRGLECLKWWRDRCIEWCFNKSEDGKFADQKYLDDWVTRFKGVHVLQYVGAGLAVWNVMNHEIKLKGAKIVVDDVPLIFYHFHRFDLLRNGKYDYGDNTVYGLLSSDNKEVIYKPYTVAIEASVKMVKEVAPKFDHGYLRFEKENLIGEACLIPSKIRKKFAKIINSFLKWG